MVLTRSGGKSVERIVLDMEGICILANYVNICWVVLVHYNRLYAPGLLCQGMVK